MPESRLSRRERSGLALLGLARRDRQAARGQLRQLTPEEQAQACMELRPVVRDEFLMLLDHPERVVPLLPPAELAGTIVASGLSEAAWLLELATPEQRVSCIDLDCWRGPTLGLTRLSEWIDALIEAGRPTLVGALDELDPELWVLSLLGMSEVVVVAKEDEPPPGYFTEDGVAYFRPRSDEDFARVKEIMGAAFAGAQARYWQLVYGMLFEAPSECEEFALKWRTGRLADLGFPEREQAMRAYRPLRIAEAPVLELGPEDAETGTGLVPSGELPQLLRGTEVGRALAELPPDRAADLLGYVFAVANTLAVADFLPLSDPDSIPRALSKAVRGIDRGLRELAEARRLPTSRVLEQTRPLDLFRIGATLDPELGPENADAADPEEMPEDEE